MVCFTSGNKMLCWFVVFFFGKFKAAIWTDANPRFSFLLLHFRTGNNLDIVLLEILIFKPPTFRGHRNWWFKILIAKR